MGGVGEVENKSQVVKQDAKEMESFQQRTHCFSPLYFEQFPVVLYRL